MSGADIKADEACLEVLLMHFQSDRKLPVFPDRKQADTRDLTSHVRVLRPLYGHTDTDGQMQPAGLKPGST